MRSAKFVAFVLACVSFGSQARPRSVRCAEAMGIEFEKNMRVRAVRPVSFANVIASNFGGVKAGDVVRTLNEVPVKSVADFEKTCAYFKAERPRRWELGVARRGESLVLAPDAGFACDPFTLVGCGPLTRAR